MVKAQETFWRAGHWPTLLSAFLYFDVSFMIWVLLGGLGNYVAGEFGMTPAQKGWMTAIPLLGGSILRLVLGQLADVIGPKKTGSIGLAATLVPLLLGWLWADSIPKIYLVGMLLGVAGASFAVALPMASRWYPPKYQGLATGIAGAGNSGTVLATLFAPRLAEAYGWEGVFGLAIIPLALAGLVFVCCAKEPPQRQSPKGVRDFVAVLQERDTWVLGFFYAVTFGGFVGLASFLSIFLRDQFGVSKVQAGDLTTACVLAGSFLRPMGGWLADRFGGIRMLGILYGIAVVLLVGVSRAETLLVAVPCFILLMGCLGIGNGSVFQLVPQRYGKRVGIATGILGAAGGLGGFMLPLVLGMVKEWTGSYGVGFGLFAVVACAALLTLLSAQRDWIGTWVAEHGKAAPLKPVWSSEKGVV